jgi:hypothetical protein
MSKLSYEELLERDKAIRGEIVVNGEPIDYSDLPEHMQDGMRLYMEQHRRPGNFLTAILENDLMGALSKADDINKHRLLDYGRWLYNNAPPNSFGSKENVKLWLLFRNKQY